MVLLVTSEETEVSRGKGYALLCYILAGWSGVSEVTLRPLVPHLQNGGNTRNLAPQPRDCISWGVQGSVARYLAHGHPPKMVTRATPQGLLVEECGLGEGTALSPSR
jgi:hypothetical protein